MTTYLSVAQIIVSLLIMGAVLLQQRGAGLGSAFGGEGGFFATRRGIQQKLYWATIVLGILFVALSVASLALNKSV